MGIVAAMIEGFAQNGYEAVRDVFQRLHDEGRETGAGLSVWRAGREVVNLSSGWRDADRRQPWTADTLVQTYSVSKPFVALIALAAVREGALDLDTPVAAYWPAYAANGKDTITLRHVLTHRAGQPRFPDSARHLDPLDDAALRDTLAAAAPEYAPGAAMGEHAMTYGHLVDGILRAATGASLDDVYTQKVRPALGLDAWFAVPDEHLHRVADLEPSAAHNWDERPSAPWLRVPAGVLDPALVNSRAWRQSVFGAVNLHATASSMAGFFATLQDEDGPLRALLGPELHAAFITSQVTGHDHVFGTRLSWTLGLIRDQGKIAKGGIGGAAAWLSLRHGHGVAYLTRHLADHSRAAEVAAVLGDDLSVVGEDEPAGEDGGGTTARRR